MFEIQFSAQDIFAWLTSSGLRILLIAIAAYIVYRFISITITRSVELIRRDTDLTADQVKQRAHTLAAVLRSLTKFVIAFIAGLTILGEFGINLGPILAGAGIAGLAVGFGAQNLVRDVLNGFFILFENQFSVGDVIKIGDQAGLVEELNLRTTQLRDLEGRHHVIPNGEIATVTNFSKDWARSLVDVDIAYKENIDRAITIIDDEGRRLAEDEEWRHALLEPPEVLGVESLGDSGVTVRMIAKTLPLRQWDVSRELRRRLKNRLDEEGIEIPFPQTTVWLGDGEAKRLADLVQLLDKKNRHSQKKLSE